MNDLVNVDFFNYGEALAAQAEAVKSIESKEHYDYAQTILEMAHFKEKDIKEYFKPYKQRAKQVHSDWCEAEKQTIEPYTKAKNVIKKAMSAYQKKVSEETGDTLKGQRESWDIEIADLSKIPSEYFIVDEARLKAEVKKLKSAFNVPGVKAIKSYVTVAR